MVKVSVLMATKNGEKTLSAAIESIRRQSFTNFELIICNDYSTDGTASICASVAQQDDRIRVLTNIGQPGLASALNQGLTQCKGAYIARMDDDDRAHPDRLVQQVAALNRQEQVAIVGTSIRLFDDQGVYGRREVKPIPTTRDIWRGQLFAHPSVMFRRAIYDQLGGYSTAAKHLRIEDYDFWCRCYAAGFVGLNLTGTYLDYREDQAAFRKRDNWRRLRLVRCMAYWRPAMHIPWFWGVFQVIELLKCAVPQRLIRHYHRFIYRISG